MAKMQENKVKRAGLQPAAEERVSEAAVVRMDYPPISKDHEHPDKPGLHALYVERAVDHLTVIKDAEEKLTSFANINLIPLRQAIAAEVVKLVKENPAYRDAAAILFAGVPKDWVPGTEQG